jgi:thiaminase
VPNSGALRQKARSSAAKYLNHFIYTIDRQSKNIGFASNSQCFIGYEAFGVSLTLDPSVADSAVLYP